MSNNSLELSNKWLKKADNDLFTARHVIQISDGPTDTVCFHNQQAVEKALKAILIFKEDEYPKIHYLIRLLDLVIPYLPALEDYREAFSDMSMFAIGIRYADEDYEPSKEEALSSLLVAEKVVQAVKDYINQ